MRATGRAAIAGAVRRWRVACGFCAVVTFTVVAGFYVPLHREAKKLRSLQGNLAAQQDTLQQALEATRKQLSGSQAQNEELLAAAGSKHRLVLESRQRLEKLKELIAAQFARLTQAKMLSVSSAADRVSVAVAMPALFAQGRPEVTKNGRALLCQLSKAIMAEHAGQIRVTGYYGKPRIEEPELSARYSTPWELSAARAASAVDAIEKGCGAPTDRFLVVGYGPRAAGPLGENIALEFIFGSSD